MLAHLQSNSGDTRYKTGDYRRYIANKYKSNYQQMNKLIEELSNIYSYTTKMRNSTYSFDKNGEAISTKKVNIDNILNTNKNARAYQKVGRFSKSIDIPFINQNIKIDIPLDIGVANV